MTAVTYLFLPAHEPRKVERALSAGSDAIILDLEDSVPDAEKHAARSAASAAAQQEKTKKTAGPELWVRINADRRYFEEDLEGIDWASAAGAFLPKAEDPETVVRLEAAGVRRIIPIVESAAGIRALSDLAGASARVERYAIGTLDLSLDLGLLAVDDVDESELIWHARADLVLQSRALKLEPPIDGVFTRLDDEPGLRRVCERAHRLGFAGKLLIHPRQIAVAAAVFKPDQAALDLAREIVQAYEDATRQGRGAIQVRGKMVDRPVAERAKALLTAGTKCR